MKGYVYTLEVIIASLLISSALIYTFKTSIPTVDYSVALIKSKCYDTLKYLDDRGLLRKYIDEGYESEIESELSSVLPVNLHIDALICDANCAPDYIPTDRNVIIIDYYSSGYRSYNFKKLRIFIWESY